jgi:hypothetical protein
MPLHAADLVLGETTGTVESGWMYGLELICPLLHVAIQPAGWGVIAIGWPDDVGRPETEKARRVSDGPRCLRGCGVSANTVQLDHHGLFG